MRLKADVDLFRSLWQLVGLKVRGKICDLQDADMSHTKPSIKLTDCVVGHMGLPRELIVCHSCGSGNCILAYLLFGSQEPAVTLSNSIGQSVRCAMTYDTAIMP